MFCPLFMKCPLFGMSAIGSFTIVLIISLATIISYYHLVSLQGKNRDHYLVAASEWLYKYICKSSIRSLRPLSLFHVIGITHFRTIIFSQSPRFQFPSPILDGLCVSFNAHHFFMEKQFMCVDCYKGRLTFSNIIYTREQSDEYWLPDKLKWGRTNVCQKL